VAEWSSVLLEFVPRENLLRADTWNSNIDLNEFYGAGKMSMSNDGKFQGEVKINAMSDDEMNMRISARDAFGDEEDDEEEEVLLTSDDDEKDSDLDDEDDDFTAPHAET